MGVYVIASKYSNWIKIGHHKISKRRPNVYYRYINRGFYSCICPDEIKDRVSFEDLDLLFWFPNLNTRSEKKIHKYLRDFYNSCGEWFETTDYGNVQDIIIRIFGGIQDDVTENDLIIAKQWCNY